MSDLTEFVVIADAVNVTTGRKSNGRPAVTRLTRTSTINADPADPRILELLAQGGVIARADLKEHVKRLNGLSGPRRPAVVRAPGGARITAAGTALSIAGDHELPEQPVEDILPLDAPDPDLTPTE